MQFKSEQMKEKYAILKGGNLLGKDDKIIPMVGKWTTLMECEIENSDKAVEDIARDTFAKLSDTYKGLKSFQVSLATRIVDFYWKHGGNVYNTLFE